MKMSIANAIENPPDNTEGHRVVSRDEWIAERKVLLAREKELTHLSDQIATQRRALPWVRIEKDYIFDTPDGRRSLADLFDGRRQLLVQHSCLLPAGSKGVRAVLSWPTTVMA